MHWVGYLFGERRPFGEEFIWRALSMEYNFSSINFLRVGGETGNWDVATVASAVLYLVTRGYPRTKRRTTKTNPQ